ncbi:hypothetical protein BH09DEP1_BH09DEP1_8660 [soil metagenome]
MNKIFTVSLALLIILNLKFIPMENSQPAPANALDSTDCKTTPRVYLKTSDGKKTFYTQIPAKPWKTIDFPFAKNHPVRCTQGNASPSDQTHFYINTLYAIDLASLPQNSAGIIYAAFGGKAFIQDGCSHATSDSSEKNACSCNQGFGNNVRILQEDGTYALYAHLFSITVKNGESVEAGQQIGIEGASGAAGHRHLHFSVHKTENPQELDLYQTPGVSIPFMCNIRYNNSTDYQVNCSLDFKADGTSFCGQKFARSN